MFELLMAFDDDGGVNEHGYNFAVHYIESALGERAAITFQQRIRATDNRYYFPNGTVNAVWREMLANI